MVTQLRKERVCNLNPSLFILSSNPFIAILPGPLSVKLRQDWLGCLHVMLDCFSNSCLSNYNPSLQLSLYDLDNSIIISLKYFLPPIPLVSSLSLLDFQSRICYHSWRETKSKEITGRVNEVAFVNTQDVLPTRLSDAFGSPHQVRDCAKCWAYEDKYEIIPTLLTFYLGKNMYINGKYKII